MRVMGRAAGVCGTIAAALIIGLAGASRGTEMRDPGWSATFYAGPVTFSDTSDVWMGKADVDGTMIGAGLNRPVLDLLDGRARFELDGSLFARLTDEGDYWEAAGGVLARWVDFPWDDAVDLSAAAGYGLSYASEVPDILEEKDDNAPRLIGALWVELEAALPERPDFALALRYHHRSAAFGVFGTDGAFDDSTALLVGLRYRFGAMPAD
jgi:hypothetical protein